MIFVYINQQDQAPFVENKRLIEQFFAHNPVGRQKVVWLEDLTQWIQSGKRGDTMLIADFLSLGKDPVEILLSLGELLQARKRVVVIKSQLEFKDDQQSQTLASALSIAAQVTQDVLTRFPIKLEKSKAGRPKGSKSINKKLAENQEDIENALRYGVKIATLARRYEVTRNTMRKFILENISKDLHPNNKNPRS